MDDLDAHDQIYPKMEAFAQAQRLPIILPNRKVGSQPSGTYLDVSLLKPRRVRLTDTGKDDWTIGIQVTVVLTSTSGEEQALIIARALQQEFPVDSYVGELKVERKVSVESGYEDVGRWRVPMTVTLRTIS